MKEVTEKLELKKSLQKITLKVRRNMRVLMTTYCKSVMKMGVSSADIN